MISEQIIKIFTEQVNKGITQKLAGLCLLASSSFVALTPLGAAAFVKTHTASFSVRLGTTTGTRHAFANRSNNGPPLSRTTSSVISSRQRLKRRLTKRQTNRLAKTRSIHSSWQAETTFAERPIPPQNFISRLKTETLAPGVLHKYLRGPLSINIVDVDMEQAPVKVQPYMAGESFDRLKDVADHAKECKALAAINANYFKKDGTPLGTLIVDGEWVAGPIFDRVSMGIDRNGKVKIDRVSLNGLLTSSNDQVNNVWVNNINQPRRHGSRLIAYTRRWGSVVKTPLAGCLVAVDSQGTVQEKVFATSISIPNGGFILSDIKEGPISSLQQGDTIKLSWHTRPNDWQDVVEAVSGGPMLVKDAKLFVDLKDENFRKAWTGSQIRARTAIGVTADNHLLLTTIEGPHTLWDVAKFLHKLGAVDAMNLDGGGSTTMVVQGATVTRNANARQRRVASSIVVIDLRRVDKLVQDRPAISSAAGALTSDTIKSDSQSNSQFATDETTRESTSEQASETKLEKTLLERQLADKQLKSNTKINSQSKEEVIEASLAPSLVP